MSHYNEKYNSNTPPSMYDNLKSIPEYSCQAKSSCSCNIGKRSSFDIIQNIRFMLNQPLEYPEYNEKQTRK